MKQDYSKISSTALACVKIRASYTDIPYSAQMMQALDRQGVKPFVPSFLQPIVFRLPGMKARFSGQEIRHLSTNFGLNKQKAFAVLEIASGFSTRGLEFSDNYELYLETDLSEIIQIKQEIAHKINPSAKNLKFSPLNPLNYQELSALGKKYFKKFKDKRVVIVQEGLMTYFSMNEQATLRDNVTKFLKTYCPLGVWITPDFSYRKKKFGFFGAILRMVQRKTTRDYNFFNSDKEAFEFLTAGKLKGKVLDNSHLLNQLTCLKKMGLNTEDVKNVAKDYRTWVITLRK